MGFNLAKWVKNRRLATVSCCFCNGKAGYFEDCWMFTRLLGVCNPRFTASPFPIWSQDLSGAVSCLRHRAKGQHSMYRTFVKLEGASSGWKEC